MMMIGMMDGSFMNSWFIGGMCALFFVLVILGIAALAKYLFSINDNALDFNFPPSQRLGKKL